MKIILQKLTSLVAMRKIYLVFALVTVMTAGALNAQITVMIVNVGMDVRATVSGSADTSNITAASSTLTPFGVARGNPRFLSLLNDSETNRAFAAVLSAGTFGDGTTTLNGSGDDTGFGLGGTSLFLSNGYESGDPIAGGTVTWAGNDVLNMGLILGDHVFTWGNMGLSEQLTITVAVPEPEEYSLFFLLCLGGLVYLGRRKKCKWITEAGSTHFM